jgi:cytochrome P450
MFAARALSEVAVKTTEITGLAAGREYFNFFFNPVGCICRLYRRHGPVMALGRIALKQPRDSLIFAIGPAFNRLLFSDPDLFRPAGLILPGPRDSAQRRVRLGLTRMIGSQHRQQRQLVAPPFHRAAAQSYHDTMVEVVQTLIAEWKTGPRIDIYEKVRALTLRIASAVLFSRDPAEAYPIERMLEDWVKRWFSIGVWVYPLPVPGAPYRRMLRQAERIEKALLEMIARRRADLGARSDVHSLLMEARDNEGRAMIDAELVGQATILFIASFETTTSALTWSLFLLAQHPAVMHDLMDEIELVLGDAPPGADQPPQLPFLQCVIKESMRILPPVPYTVRVAQRPLKVGPFGVSQETRVVASHYLTHHLPDLYPEPERFRPERWRDINPTQYEYLPFNAGPRICVGAALATQVLKISLAMILLRFRFTVVPGTHINRIVAISMNPRHGLPMIIAKKDRNYSVSEVRGQIREMVNFPSNGPG